MRAALFFIFILFSVSILAQKNIQDTCIVIPSFSAGYSIQLPGGDMADRFGMNSAVSGSFSVKLRSNWVLSADFDFLFGTKLKEYGILDSLKTSEDVLINKYGEFSKILLSERGFYAGGSLGKIIPVYSPNPNSGLMVSLGGGLLQHKIRIENDGNNTPAVLGEYKKGYDRLTNGFCLKEFIGYRYYGNRQSVNFYFGFEFYQAWTQNRRSFNFDIMEQDTRQRLDLLYSIKVGWLLPMYHRMPKEFYFD